MQNNISQAEPEVDLCNVQITKSISKLKLNYKQKLLLRRYQTI